MQGFLRNIWSLFVVLLILAGSQIHAQVKVQVVTQTISKSIHWEAGMTLRVQAERAEIYCTTHPSDSIELDIQFIAKNENRNTAEADLKKMKWLIETSGKKVFLRNYIELERNESHPESDIKVIYHIKVPQACAVNLNNYFGKIDVVNVSSGLTINSEFSGIKLQNVHGKTTIETTFGDVSGRGIDGNLQLVSKRSNIQLSELSGSISLRSILADITLSELDEITEIKIDAEKSKINIRAGNFDNYYFQFDLAQAELDKPESMKLTVSKNEKETIKASFNKPDNHPLISIDLEIGSLTIEH
jgi:hypothetical protein